MALLHTNMAMIFSLVLFSLDCSPSLSNICTPPPTHPVPRALPRSPSETSATRRDTRGKCCLLKATFRYLILRNRPMSVRYCLAQGLWTIHLLWKISLCSRLCGWLVLRPGGGGADSCPGDTPPSNVASCASIPGSHGTYISPPRETVIDTKHGHPTRDCWNPYSKCGCLNCNVSKHYL